MFARIAALISALGLVFATPAHADPYIAKTAKKSGLCKSAKDQSAKPFTWTTFAGCEPYKLNGKRSLFFAQLHLTCTVKPNYVKIRLARILPDGSLDTTGTNTWLMGKAAPKAWQGATWWESNTKYPIVAQYKQGGGKCVSPQRQIKWWQP